MKPEGGAVASFGPAGIADAAAQAAFYERLYAVLAARKISLGEAIRRAKGQALAADPRVGPVVESWNLLGDPAVIVDGLVAGSPEGR
jgi:peptidase C25-like protein